MSIDPRLTLIVSSAEAAVRRPPKLEGRGRWFIEQRLRFIESRLFWSGSINRRDLVDQFQITQAIASQDLADYQTLARGNAVYDKSAKLYRAGRSFRPLFPNPSLSAVYAHALLHDGSARLDEMCEIPPAIERTADPVVARNLAAACRNHFALRIRYRSMATPDGEWRWIEPRNLATDGVRWHVRAWCRSREAFRDFVLSRIEQAEEPGKAIASDVVDTEWETMVEVVIQPHPALSAAQAALVRHDYEMERGLLRLQCRQALLWYLLRNTGLDVDDRPPRQVLSLRDPELRKVAGLLRTQR